MAIYALFLSISLTLFKIISCSDVDNYEDYFVNSYGYNGVFNLTSLQILLDSYRGNFSEHVSSHQCTGNTTDQQCVFQCMDAEEIFKFHNLSKNAILNSTSLSEITPTILFQIRFKDCDEEAYAHEEHPNYDKTKVWGYGLAAVTIINFAALTGVCFKPLMKTKVYRKVLLYMIGLAVGALASNGLLVLVPEALELNLDDGYFGQVYLNRMVSILGGIWLFCLVERFLKMISLCKSRNEEENEDNFDKPMASVSTIAPSINDTMGTYKVKENETSNHSHNHFAIQNGNAKIVDSNEDSETSPEIKSIAWMIIFGDGLHNFIDGLAIGASFVEGPFIGVSLSLGILLEELPHELGDFAILLQSGMTIKQALLANFASACSCYAGLVVGIAVGELTGAGVWIFGIAGGMFLYISLVDMMPEMNHLLDEEMKSFKGCAISFLLQNLGMLSGFAVIYILCLYGDRIV